MAVTINVPLKVASVTPAMVTDCPAVKLCGVVVVIVTTLAARTAPFEAIGIVGTPATAGVNCCMPFTGIMVNGGVTVTAGVEPLLEPPPPPPQPIGSIARAGRAASRILLVHDLIPFLHMTKIPSARCPKIVRRRQAPLALDSSDRSRHPASERPADRKPERAQGIDEIQLPRRADQGIELGQNLRVQHSRGQRLLELIADRKCA